MAAASCLLTEDQFLCSICLDVFTDPVTLPCGHNFCKSCIAEHWNSSVKRQCPVCNKLCNKGLKLQVNTFISEMAAQFRQSAQHKTSSSEQHAAKPGDVPCDICTGPELKALKSCLVCLTSYCGTHLEPHLTKSGLKRHQLIDPVKNLEDRMCKKHDKLLELFCKSDHMCVCMMCAIADHKTHHVVAMKEECEGQKSELVKTEAQIQNQKTHGVVPMTEPRPRKKTKMTKAEAEIQQMIKKRRVKIEEIRRSVELSNKAADREMAEGVQVFTALKETVERSQAELIKTITEKQRTTEKQAEDFITELEQEISDLKKRSSEVEQLSQSEDQLHLLRLFQYKDWTEVRVRPPSYEGTMVRAVKQLKETLLKLIQGLFEAELQRVQQFAVNVLLKPVMLINYLFMEMFRCKCSYSLKSFASGRFYFEVGVNDSSPWTLGVARISTEEQIALRPSNHYWTVCSNPRGEHYAAADPPVRLSVGSLGMVGVFVDYEEGLVSFYDVDAAALIYCFAGCSFAGRIHPFFSSCPNNGVRGSWWRRQELCLH